MKEPATVREIAVALGREDDSFRRQVRAAIDALQRADQPPRASLALD
jgi:hypothetical protein